MKYQPVINKSVKTNPLIRKWILNSNARYHQDRRLGSNSISMKTYAYCIRKTRNRKKQKNTSRNRLAFKDFNNLDF
ncbi:hypothetical protein BO224_06130 [Erysipelotrichaceae bacterium NYU-BL-E8]|uniref:Uncharacterized protein n=1 Tax=Ileibacterium valens TaxID=1862668 RepID=A0A1U7NIF8_9FIRM|nr:hypothetical protein BO224_06130 [Erysipelotrichaceae bacterium NYU-BL-E8]OLU42264.1 hypothetical protein BO222_01885 [Ileibacterium valens]OLU42478.1 hypothetical protein BM735_02225 [Erysipelotrichaceae bacterium NYU-BL-F16]